MCQRSTGAAGCAASTAGGRPGVGAGSGQRSAVPVSSSSSRAAFARRCSCLTVEHCMVVHTPLPSWAWGRSIESHHLCACLFLCAAASAHVIPADMLLAAHSQSVCLQVPAFFRVFLDFCRRFFVKVGGMRACGGVCRRQQSRGQLACLSLPPCARFDRPPCHQPVQLTPPCLWAVVRLQHAGGLVASLAPSAPSFCRSCCCVSLLCVYCQRLCKHFACRFERTFVRARWWMQLQLVCRSLVPPSASLLCVGPCSLNSLLEQLQPSMLVVCLCAFTASRC